MKKSFLLFLAVIALVLVTGCGKKVEQTQDGTKTTEDNLVTDDVSYVTESTEITIHRNKVTKNAEIDMVYKIKDEEEEGRGR